MCCPLHALGGGWWVLRHDGPRGIKYINKKKQGNQTRKPHSSNKTLVRLQKWLLSALGSWWFGCVFSKWKDSTNFLGRFHVPPHLPNNALEADMGFLLVSNYSFQSCVGRRSSGVDVSASSVACLTDLPFGQRRDILSCEDYCGNTFLFHVMSWIFPARITSLLLQVLTRNYCYIVFFCHLLLLYTCPLVEQI